MTAPPITVEPRTLSGGRIVYVVRDDHVLGGTKARVLPGILEAFPEDEFVFGGPAQGYAQVALAYSCAAIGRRATYFVAQRRQRHPLTLEAERAGARIVEVAHGRLNVVQARARAYCAETGARFLPLGFDIPEFHAALVAAAADVPVAPPPEVWCVAGSGALSRALETVWPDAEHHAVRIGFAPKIGTAQLHEAPEPFEKPAQLPPPFPSCANYDAKLWRFVNASARSGALVWNVAA